ncbi:MAG TPA: ABC transporter permease [Hyphomicrobiales bacterium]|nr:ABC transporter permease [Hyphomicrobiales bacterium]
MNPAIRAAWLIGSIAVTALLVLVWQLIADYSGIPPVFLPGPDRSWNALMSGIGGELGMVTVATIRRMFYGWVLASVAGIALGALIGSSKAAREYLAPTLEMIRPVPVSAFMPVVIAFIGLSGDMVLVVIAIGAIWPTLLGTVHGVSNVEPRLKEVSRSLKLGRLETIWKIALPNAQADILAGARLGLTVSLILAVVGEMLTSEDGLGFYILTAARAYHSDQLFAGVILLGLIGLVSNLVLQAVEWRVLRWRRR